MRSYSSIDYQELNEEKKKPAKKNNLIFEIFFAQEVDKED